MDVCMQVVEVSLQDGVTPHVIVFASVLSAIYRSTVLDDEARVQQAFQIAYKMKQMDVEVQLFFCFSFLLCISASVLLLFLASASLGW